MIEKDEKEQLKAAEKAMIEWLSHPEELGKEPYKIECASAYWMERARKQEEFQAKFRENTDFRTQEEIPADTIESQFVKSESRFFIKVGQIDCPTGKIIAADPLAYLPSPHCSPVLTESIPAGTYSVEVSICRQQEVGLRMCTARLRIKDAKVVAYKKTTATNESVIKLKDGGVLEGFPVDAGMICLCDVQTAEEYRVFLDKWYAQNPERNHYDDYFAAFFAKSYKEMPAYQREGGDFIEWTNPDTGSRMVMIASGFGDGFYNSYYGYDIEGKICEIIVPMVNPAIFGC